MFAAESNFGNAPGKLSMPPLPGMGSAGSDQRPNPFSGIRRAGQAKRAQNFEKFQTLKSNQSLNAGSMGSGAKNRFAGGDFGTQVGSMKQSPFE